MNIIDPNFFIINPVQLAQKLLGKILVRKINDQIIKVRIVETEAYNGKTDKACHAHLESKSRWKSATLYKRGGHAYVYLTYGIYYCFNITSADEGDPQGVLIRAVEPLDKQNIGNFSHQDNKKNNYYTNGPGKLCRALNIDKNFNGVDLITNDLIYLENQPEVDEKNIIITKRINIDNAGEDKNLLWRFYIKDNPFVSRK